MANTFNSLNGVSLAVIVQESLPVLQKNLPSFAAFTTNYGDYASPVGASVTTRIPTAITAVDFSTSDGFKATPVSSSAVTVTLSSYKHATAKFTDTSIQNGGIEVLANTFIRPLVYAVYNAIHDDAMALVTNANYGAPAYSGSTFTFSDYSKGIKHLKQSGSMGQYNVVLNSDAFYTLCNDIKSNYVIGDASVIRQGVIGSLAGATVYEDPALPTNSETLAGFACTPAGICIATRFAEIPTNFAGEIETVQLPGMPPIQLRKWYSADEGGYKLSANCIYGVSKGHAASLKRYVFA